MNEKITALGETVALVFHRVMNLFSCFFPLFFLKPQRQKFVFHLAELMLFFSDAGRKKKVFVRRPGVYPGKAARRRHAGH